MPNINLAQITKMRPFFIVVALISAPLAASAQNTATVTQSAPVYVTNIPAANLAPLRVAAVGTVLKVLGQEGDWLQVEFEDPQWGRRSGWVHKGQVRVSDPTLRPMDLSIRDTTTPAVPPSSVPNGASQQMPESATDLSVPEDHGLSASPTPARQASAVHEVHHAIEQGTTELQLLGTVTGLSAEGETAWVSTVNATVGFFATPHLEFGSDVGLFKAQDVDTGTVTGFAAYNFNSDSPVVGFVGGGAGGGFGLGDLNPFVLQVFGGFRVLTPGGGGALVVRPFYQRNFYSDEFLADINTFGVAVGASILF